ncbi:MAG: beta-galactosidase [Lacunisphaera sp.]|nr:beta-galactosidase [Lacunisphaera sp.]
MNLKFLPVLACLCFAPLVAAPLTMTLPAAALPGNPAERGVPGTNTGPAAAGNGAAENFHMGTARAPDGTTLTIDARTFRLNGTPWTPVMGEFHYARYPENEWRGELLKMKAGGIDIVATYVFWIHHEEIEGRWEWTGDKNLHRFVQTAAEVGLKVIVRCGPWCHGEVRNGGLPDWIVARGHTRTEDPAFLASTTQLYGQIAAQLAGLLWKDGGPVIGIQLDNEYDGPASYLLSLKKIARAAGLDVPLYTRTGWPELKTPMPFGEIVPLYGVYAEGFWDRELTSMPGSYWAGFHFSKLRTDANIAQDALGGRDARDAPDVARYPYLTCEIGGGMMSSYHRRILVDPRDVEATTLVKLGSGSISPGYYMYHGGTNPDGKRTTLMEEQATAITNWNDMPVKNYDFQTALGQYGQVRPQYFMLRRLHLFLHDFGQKLAGMDTVLPDQRAKGKDDTTTLRWAARSDGQSGFVFVNNYERSRALPAKDGVQFALKLANGSTVTFPAAPVSIPADARFIWPFNLDLGGGITLRWATAQPLAIRHEGAVRTIYFAATHGLAPQFCFGPDVDPLGPAATASDDAGKVYELAPGSVTAVSNVRRDTTQVLRLAVLSESDSLAFGLKISPPMPRIAVAYEQIKTAGPLRKIAPGKIQQPVAAAPVDADFADAAVWRITVPRDDDLAADMLLRLNYTGDVARVYIGGKLITDDFYNGRPLEIGLRRHAAELKHGELTIAILPLQKNAPLFLPESAKPDFGAADSVVALHSVELVWNQSVESAGP